MSAYEYAEMRARGICRRRVVEESVLQAIEGDTKKEERPDVSNLNGCSNLSLSSV